MDYHYEHVHQMDDNQQLGPKIIMTSDTLGALNSASAVWVNQHPCPFCTSGYAYHRFHKCPVLADTIRSGYAYQNGKIDPKQNTDNQQPEGVPSSPGHSCSKPIDNPVSKPGRGYGQRTHGGGRVGYSGGRGQSSAMSSVQRSTTPL